VDTGRRAKTGRPLFAPKDFDRIEKNVRVTALYFDGRHGNDVLAFDTPRAYRPLDILLGGNIFDSDDF
jgi:hypothetical protein